MYITAACNGKTFTYKNWHCVQSWGSENSLSKSHCDHQRNLQTVNLNAATTLGKPKQKMSVAKLSLLCFATSKIQTLFLHKQPALSQPFILSFKGSNVISATCCLWKQTKHMAQASVPFKCCFQTMPVPTKPSRGHIEGGRYSVASWYLGVFFHITKYRNIHGGAQMYYPGCLGQADHISKVSRDGR